MRIRIFTQFRPMADAVLWVILSGTIFNNGYAQLKVMDAVFESSPPFPTLFDDARPPGGKVVGPGLFAHGRPVFEAWSETNQQYAGTSNGDLYIRDADSDTLLKTFKPRKGWYWHMESASWSPDGRYLAVRQVNDSEVPKITLSHRDPNDISKKPYSRVGEALPQHQLYIVNIATGENIELPQAANIPYVHMLEWSDDSRSYRYLQTDRLMKTLHIFEYSLQAGAVKKLFSDSAETFLLGLPLLQGYNEELKELKLVTFLDKRKEFIYASERSGYLQLYLYNWKGELIKPLSDFGSNGRVVRLMAADENNGWVYFIASHNAANPYDQQLFRSSLGATKIEQLVEGPQIEDVVFSEAMDSMMLVRMGMDFFQFDLFNSDGRFLETLWKANLQPIREFGLNVERARFSARDDSTMLEAMIWRPGNFDSALRYPVIEYIYAGKDKIVPDALFDPSLYLNQELANQGFVVVAMDTRGSTDRGKAFMDYNYRRFGQVEIDEHVAGLRQLASNRPYMDLDRLGIFGHSWGGYFTLRALVGYPDFYKAGAVMAAAVDPIDFRVSLEPFMGCLPADCSEKYQMAGVTSYLKNLKAPLMIIHGTADDDVPFTEAEKLVKALDAFGYKDYQFIKVQGANHALFREPDLSQKLLEFFRKVLLLKKD